MNIKNHHVWTWRFVLIVIVLNFQLIAKKYDVFLKSCFFFNLQEEKRNHWRPRKRIRGKWTTLVICTLVVDANTNVLSLCFNYNDFDIDYRMMLHFSKSVATNKRRLKLLRLRPLRRDPWVSIFLLTLF